MRWLRRLFCAMRDHAGMSPTGDYLLDPSTLGQITMTTPEGRVKAKLKKALNKAFGKTCYCFMPVQTGYGAPTLDYLICIAGRFVGIETKKPGGKPTPRQETTIQTIRDAGGLVFVVDGDEAIEYAINHIKAEQGADRSG